MAATIFTKAELNTLHAEYVSGTTHDDLARREWERLGSPVGGYQAVWHEIATIIAKQSRAPRYKGSLGTIAHMVRTGGA